MASKKQLLNLFLLFFCFIGSTQAQALNGSKAAISKDSIAIVINDKDPTSEIVAEYYQRAYQLSDDVLIHVSIDPNNPSISKANFEALKIEINRQLSIEHQAVLFLWTKPFQVECQSLTSAFTLGFDPNICKKTCDTSQQNPYFDKPNNNVLTSHAMRLSMLLPTNDIDLATEVIDRGVISQKGVFKSTAYYLNTTDKLRNSRAHFFPKNGLSFKGTGLSVVNKTANDLIDIHDIMIYQTGAAHVKYLPTLGFLPGALADHLTSFGGQLLGKAQMSIIAWLRAGATASYGTVSEPCNYWQKFPNSSVLLRWYVSGNTAIEAYWKSVAWPSQGLFIGDPLASPFITNRN